MGAVIIFFFFFQAEDGIRDLTVTEVQTCALPILAPPGFVPIATVIWVVEDVTVLPSASCTVTWTAGVRLAPALVVTGCTVNARLAATPGMMLKALLVADVRPVADAAR